MRIKKSWITTAIILAAGSYFLITLFSENNDEKYLEELKELRAKKDDYFKTSDQSPIQNKDSFPGINYFPPDLSFRCLAEFNRSDEKEQFRMAMTDGAKEKYSIVGKLTFNLKGEYLELTAFKRLNDRDNQLFVPFTDLTNGSFTYGGGRYLDVKYQGKSKILLDFNQAYQPYCAYNKSFICPIPPQENNINIEITAGEMLPE